MVFEYEVQETKIFEVDGRSGYSKGDSYDKRVVFKANTSLNKF